MYYNDIQKFNLYLFNSYYLLNKDYNNEELLLEIVNMTNNIFITNSKENVNLLYNYIDHIFDSLNISFLDSKKYTNINNYDNVYKKLISINRKNKLKLILI